MSIRYYYKKPYELSKRNYLDDYSKIESKKIDMTLSGKYLSVYPRIHIPFSEFDKYPLISNIKKFENTVKSKIKTNCEIIVGSGANGILQNIVKVYFGKGEKGNIVTPYFSFNQVEYAVTSLGGSTKRAYTKNYNVSIDNIIKSIDNNTKLIYICNPINPTGQIKSSNDYISLAKAIKIPLVIDESGIEFSNQKSILDSCNKLPSNLLVVRSFSKAYGLANLRLGYLACSKEFKKKYIKRTTTNEYSGLSCMIANLMLLKAKRQVKKNINNILEERNYLERELKQMGINIVESFSNTIFTKTIFDESLVNVLEQNDISVVYIYDKDNNLHIRIAVQDKKTNKKFISILKSVIKNNNLIIGEYDD